MKDLPHEFIGFLKVELEDLERDSADLPKIFQRKATQCLLQQ